MEKRCMRYLGGPLHDDFEAMQTPAMLDDRVRWVNVCLPQLSLKQEGTNSGALIVVNANTRKNLLDGGNCSLSTTLVVDLRRKRRSSDVAESAKRWMRSW
jgi:hypothetical protein